MWFHARHVQLYDDVWLLDIVLFPILKSNFSFIKLKLVLVWVLVNFYYECHSDLGAGATTGGSLRPRLGQLQVCQSFRPIG